MQYVYIVYTIIIEMLRCIYVINKPLSKNVYCYELWNNIMILC